MTIVKQIRGVRPWLGLLAVVFAAGCGDGAPSPDEDVSTTKHAYSAPITSCTESGINAGAPASAQAFLSRAFDWVHKGVMYCQCPMSGSGAYRADCSGFVSYIWGLPAPGEVTYQFATGSQDDHSSVAIAWSDVTIGDALNFGGVPGGAGHIMLFAGWRDSSHTNFCAVEESHTGTPAHISEHSVNDPASWWGGSGSFTDAFKPIRKAGYTPSNPPPSPPPSTLPRIGVLATDGTVVVKAGDLSAPWAGEYTGAKQVIVDGTRIGVLASDGTVWVKDGDLGAQWTNQLGGASQIALSGNRIGAVMADGNVLVKEGALNAPWANVLGGAKQIALSGDRIGVVANDGHGLVKAGDLSAQWTDQSTDTQRIALSGNRIGILLTGGKLLVKEGDLGAQWTDQLGGVTQIALSGNRIGVVTTGDSTLVKEGDLNAQWATVFGGAKQIALSGNRIGVIATDNNALVKEGALSAPWSLEYGGAQQISLY